MAKLRYIGSKARISEVLLDFIGKPSSNQRVFVDVFSGTGVISRAAALRGWRVIANDYLYCSSLITTAQLLSPDDVKFAPLGGYEAALARLNAVDPVEGFIYREYTPSGRSVSGQERRYFTVENGARIDGIRGRIEDWRRTRQISELERALLIADLLGAANHVANIAGTYGCFLRAWEPAALKPLKLAARTLLPYAVDFRVLNTDSFLLNCPAESVAYVDPPYTKRQYAAYYHILETIAKGDQPRVEGVTGLRPWKDKLSDFCYKQRALRALERLMDRVGSRRIVLSYSSEGHMGLASVEKLLTQMGSVRVKEIETIGRYRPNPRASAARSHVKEYVVELLRARAKVEVS